MNGDLVAFNNIRSNGLIRPTAYAAITVSSCEGSSSALRRAARHLFDLGVLLRRPPSGIAGHTPPPLSTEPGGSDGIGSFAALAHPFHTDHSSFSIGCWGTCGLG